MRHAFLAASIFLSVGIAVAIPPARRTVTFEDRVKAQEAIERVYYSHQIGATKPFEQAVPRTVLETKVRKYLDETAALGVYWKIAVTDEMLQRELERMAHGTRMPERLIELYRALGNDSFVIKECLARATVVDRLTRSFQAFDSTIHAEARRRAEELLRQLSVGGLSPTADHPNRTVVELVTSDKAVGESDPWKPLTLSVNGTTPFRRQLSPGEFRKQRAQLPEDLGHVSALTERSDAFVFSAVLREVPGEVRVAIYAISKTTWDDWWDAAKRSLRSAPVPTVAADRGPLPMPAAGPSLRVGVYRLRANSLPCPDDTWSDVNPITGLAARIGHSAVWTGSLMLVWGGLNDGVFLNSGGRYDPATDAWTEMSTLDAPSVRYYHTAVWTGGSMVVWGGYDGTSMFNTGGRYDPLTDSWAATSTIAAPLGCYGHTAVWTGSRMVVWGGQDSPDYPARLNTGGRYDPATDTWTSTSTIGTPSSREWHSAIWTGSRMIVWGGLHSSNYVSSGARYDPATDAWTELSSAGAPSARFAHTAVWTGSRMVIWGGFDGIVLNTGAQYNPVGDVWTTTSIDGAPLAVSGTTVWTGSHMVVWGGWNGTTDVNTGARYNPATDSWASISTTGAPSARDGQVAVWTGSSMVVWGGTYHDIETQAFSWLDSGGRYEFGATVDNDGDGYSECQGDCNGSDASVYPGAPQLCDGKNNNCSDPSWPTMPTNEADADHDGYRICHGDCNDGDASVYPGAPQLCDGKNNNCSDPSWPTMPTNEADADQDGFRICGDDCNDSNPSIHPGAPEICNAIDDNCNGLIDEDPQGVDSDGDGVHSACDNCPQVYNATQTDSDHDGVGNACDNCVGTYNPSQADADHDGGGDVCDSCTDTDGDGYGNPGFPANNCPLDNCPLVANSNQTDSDGDGIGSACDACPSDPQNDIDADGVCGNLDNCPSVPNTNQVDVDSDGRGDVCDNCPAVANANQIDSDTDGSGNACDNCLMAHNPDQIDADHDSLGDACDNCPMDSNASQGDLDSDGVGDACDDCLFDSNSDQSDIDHDGEGDICDLNDGLIYILGTDDRNYVEWQAESGYTSWNSYRGSLAVLRATGQYTQAPGSNPVAGHDCGLSDPYVLDVDVPAPGEVAFNLVTGLAGGFESSLGTNSAGVTRVNTTPNCTPPLGACCTGINACSERTQVNCLSVGGIYHGDYSTCASSGGTTYCY